MADRKCSKKTCKIFDSCEDRETMQKKQRVKLNDITTVSNDTQKRSDA